MDKWSHFISEVDSLTDKSVSIKTVFIYGNADNFPMILNLKVKVSQKPQ
jgi:hypothetical protein